MVISQSTDYRQHREAFPIYDLYVTWRWRGRAHIWFNVGIRNRKTPLCVFILQLHVGVATDNASGSVMKSGQVHLKQGVFTPTVNYTVHIKRLAVQELFIQQPGTHCLITGFNQSRKPWLRLFFNILPRSTKMTRGSGGELTFYLPSVERHVCHLWLYTANVEHYISFPFLFNSFENMDPVEMIWLMCNIMISHVTVHELFDAHWKVLWYGDHDEHRGCSQ